MILYVVFIFVKGIYKMILNLTDIINVTMEFYIDETDGFEAVDDKEFQDEFEYLGTEENDLLCTFDNEKCDDTEMKNEPDVNYKFKDSESFSNDAIEFSVINGKDIWNEKHAWAINNQETSNSNYHLEFIGGSPESAKMVNPNIVIPKDKFFYDMGDHRTPNVTEKKTKKSDSFCQTDAVVLPVNETRVESFVNKSVKLSKLGDLNVKISTNDLISFPVDVNDNSQPNDNCKSILSRHMYEKELVVTVSDDFYTKYGIKEEVIDRKNVQTEHYQNSFLYPKPAFSYACLISMALKNSRDGCLPVSEIYNFMCHHFPYFKTAPNGWKNSVRHNLSLNKCFEKIEKPVSCVQRKGCLWAMNPDKAKKMDEEVSKWICKHREGIQKSMVFPDKLELLEKGELKMEYTVRNSYDEFIDEEFECETEPDLNELNNIGCQKASNIDTNDEVKGLIVQDENIVSYTKCDDLFVSSSGSVVPASIIVLTDVEDEAATTVTNVGNEEYITVSSNNVTSDESVISVIQYDGKEQGKRNGGSLNSKKTSKISLKNVNDIIAEAINGDEEDDDNENLINEFVRVQHVAPRKQRRVKLDVKSSTKGTKQSRM